MVSPDTAGFVALGDTTRLAAEVSDQNGQALPGASITWTSGDTAVVTVDSAGLVMAAGNGSTSVTAASGEASGTSEITVEQVATGVRVSPSVDTLRALGADLQLSATATDANGHAVSGYEFDWSSRDETVATVDSTGLVLANSNGRTHIIAGSGAWADSADITVTQTASRIELSPPPDTLRTYGDTVRITAVGFDANGHRVPAGAFLWASRDTFVVTIDQTGLVTAVGNGTTDVSASAGEANMAVAVTVSDSAGAIAADRTALVALYNATGGPNWTSNDNWLTDQPLSRWSGVTTDGEGRVSTLNLGSRELTGSIPSELGRLSSLERLLLGSNQLTGSIPPELGNLANLNELSLGFNQLTGSIPPGLGRLSNLERLALGSNQLSGAIPSELGDLASLTVLSLGLNQLTGSIPAEFGPTRQPQTTLARQQRSYGQEPTSGDDPVRTRQSCQA